LICPIPPKKKLLNILLTQIQIIVTLTMFEGEKSQAMQLMTRKKSKKIQKEK